MAAAANGPTGAAASSRARSHMWCFEIRLRGKAGHADIRGMESKGYWRMRRRATTLAAENFEFVPAACRAPGNGELRVRTRFIALDPYLSRPMRGWSGEVPGWQDGTIHGRVIAEVVESRAPGFAPGDTVFGVGRWQDEQCVAAANFEKVSETIDPPSLRLGVLGASGITGWVGLRLAAPKPGETLLVSAATGPVGSVVGQLARAQGLHVIGIAGGADKCRHAVDRLGFAHCLDHREPDLAARIAGAAPGGVDILFENVGGASLDAGLAAMARHGRILLCGLAAHYRDDAPLALRHFKQLLYAALTLRGFITAEHPELHAPALEALRQGVASGTLLYDETLIDGLENAPAAYLDMLGGGGVGKRIIRL